MTAAQTSLPADAEYASVAATSRILSTRHDGIGISWRVWGEGPPVVLVHGGYGSWTHWIRNVRALSPSYRVIVPDLPGLGASPSLPDGTPIPSVGAALAAGIDEIAGGGQIHGIVGFSFGGVISGRAAACLRGRVSHYVMVGAAGLGLPFVAREKPLISWRKLETREEVLAVHRHNLSAHMIHDEAKIDELAVQLQAENTANARLRSRPISRTALLFDALADIDARLTGIWGEQDVTSLGALDARRDLIRSFDPQAEFIVLPGVGHWVQYEAAQAFNETLLRVLASRV